MLHLSSYEWGISGEPYSMTLSEENYRKFVESGFIYIVKTVPVGFIKSIEEAVKSAALVPCHVFFNRLSSWEQDTVKLKSISYTAQTEFSAERAEQEKIRVNFFYEYLKEIDPKMSVLEIALKNDINRALKIK